MPIRVVAVGGFAANLQTEITMMKCANAGGRTKRTNERSIVFRPPAWSRWHRVKTTY